MWRGNWQGDFEGGGWVYSINEATLLFANLPKYWDLLNAVARGERDKSVLPVPDPIPF
jgi:hypothetical protein